MKRDEAYEKGLVSVLIYMVLYIVKWLCLMVGVVFAAITIALAVMSLLKGSDLPSAFLAQMVSFISGFELDKVTNLIQELGIVKVEVAGIGYSFALSLIYCLTYVLVAKFVKLFTSIFSGNMFTKENVLLINSTIPLSIIAAFAPAVIVYTIIEIIGVFTYENIIIHGVAFICISYILKLIFEKGYETEKKNARYDKQIADLKAQENELKMEAIKKEAELKAAIAAKKELEKETKSKTEPKKTTKKETKITKKVTKTKEEKKTANK